MDRAEDGATQSGLRETRSTATEQWVSCGVKRDQDADVPGPVPLRRVWLTEDPHCEEIEEAIRRNAWDLI